MTIRKRGRPSAAELAVVPLTGRAPAVVPPSALPPDVRGAWDRVVRRTPLNWFQPEMADLLAAYAQAIAGGARMRKAMRASDLSLDDYARMAGIAQREEALALSFARALRLTVQSRIAPRSAGRRAEGDRPADISVLFEEVPDE